MNAELIAVGSELLRFGKRDGNSEWLARQLQPLGVEVTARTAVDDHVERIVSVVRSARSRAAVVLTTGGLGPTEDDRTREALGRVLDAPLEFDQTQVERMRELYARHGRSFGDREAGQARRPRGSSWIDNPIGSAAGLLVEDEGRILAALPGVPAEMRAMFAATLRPLLARAGLPPLGGVCLKIAGRTESSLDGRIRDLYDAPELDVTVLGGTDGLELHARARAVPGGDDAAAAALAEFEREVRHRLGADVLGTAEDEPAAVVGGLLRRHGRTVATAESCTAGLLGAALTAVPGSSDWYRGGVIPYSDDLKTGLAGVGSRTLAEHGAVSEAVARELARGARDRCGADLALALTGIAGPGGGSAEKPVGLVHLALQDGADDSHHRCLRLIGDRNTIRRRSVSAALDLLRRRLLKSDG